MNNFQSTEMFKTIKRYGITILCCIPFMILFGFFTQKYIGNVLNIVINTLFMGVVLLIEELIHKRKQKFRDAKTEVLHKNEDVFK